MTARRHGLFGWNFARTALALCSFAAAAAQVGWGQEAVWPMADNSHDVLHSYQNPFSSGAYFHEGVDLRGGLADVRAMRAGVVRYHSQSTWGGTLVVEVETPGGSEADAYLHLLLDPWIVGEWIERGDVVGQVSTSYFGLPLQHHTHLNRFNGYAGGTGYLPGRTNMLHPLALFVDPADRDPQQLAAGPSDSDGDGILFWVAPHDSNTTRLSFAFGQVDLLLEASDRQTSSIAWNQGLVSVGYWVDRIGVGDGIRSATEPYRLVSFDDAWRASHMDCDQLLSDVMLTQPGFTVQFGSTNTAWATLANYTLTNTRGVSGSGAEVDATQHWRTDALAGSGWEPNGSDAGVAREIHEARFPDGLYQVHALTGDLVTEIDSVFHVVVDNYRPYVERVEVQALRSGSLLYDRGWSFSPLTGTLDFNDAVGDAPEPTGFSDGVMVSITFSEPVATADIERVEPSIGFRPRLRSRQPVGQRTIWIAEIPGIVGSMHEDLHRLRITAVDLNGSSLYPFASTAPVSAPFNKRVQASTLGTASADTLHWIPLSL